MKELLYAMVGELVEDESAIEITVDEPKEDGTIVYHLHVAPNDMGRVIGKQGRIAKAIRTIMRAGAVRQRKGYGRNRLIVMRSVSQRQFALRSGFLLV